MKGDLRQTKNGDPLMGTQALEDVIEQLISQAKFLTLKAEWLKILRAELPDDLSGEAQAALALLVTGGGR